MFNNRIKKYISVLLTIAMTTASLMVGMVAYGEDLVAINDQYFPDANWRKIVSSAYDKDHDGFLSESERDQSFMSISGYLERYCGENAVIEDLTGINYFANVERLYVGSLGLKSLDVSKLKNLKQLTCQGNKLKTLIIGSNPNLTFLNCTSNNLQALNILGCYKLERLLCSSNQLARIDLSGNPELTELSIYDNDLERLDVSSNSLLEEIYCSGNHLTTLDLSHNTKLGEVTQYMIGDQTVSASARVSGKTVAVPFSLDSSKVASTSLDVLIEGEGGDTSENKVVSGYSSTGSFTTKDVKNFRLDGYDNDVIIYDYEVNNPNCENMNVVISVIRDFYQVNTYTNDSMTHLITTQFVNSGKNAVAPTITDYPEDKIFGGWSASFENITEDKDIYIRWINEHIWTVTRFDNGDVTIHCDDCGDEYSFTFNDVLNLTEEDEHFVPVLDAVKDGILNAKDYAKLHNQFNQ